MSLFSPEALAARRNLVNTVMLNQEDCYVLRRVLIDDGGGTDIETFVKDAVPFKAQPQKMFERAQDGVVVNSAIDMSDMTLIYDHGITLKQEDRILMGTMVYTVRNVYDNITTGMTNQAYITVVQNAQGTEYTNS